MDMRPAKTNETGRMQLQIERTAKTLVRLGGCPVWPESSLYAQYVAKDPSFLHADSEDSDQAGRDA